MRRRARDAPAVLRVDPIACDGIGMCAHVAADAIALDPWGFPVVPAEPVDGSQARRAVRACPRRALRIHAAS